jgi:hypothetical protein
MMTIYNLWGKRTPLPPLTDAIQGVGWSTIGLYGICVLNYSPTMLTGAFLVYVFVLVLMINGVHGALRDLTNDFHQGMLTTAILLGARPKGDLGIHLPLRLKYYALILQVFLLGSSLLPLLANWFGYRPVTWGITTTVMGLVAAATLYCLVRAIGSVDNRWNLIQFGMFHLVLSLGMLVLPFLYVVQGTLRVVLLTVYLVPVLVMWLRYGFKWG